MNNDLISRKYVIRELLKEREHYPPMVAERYSFGVKLPHHFNQAMRGGIRKGLRIAETAPSVDAEPVRHGKWAHLGGDEWCCTVCGEVIHTEGSWEKPTRKYCHECGAKMHVEVEDAAD